jgi:malate dehydrogenase (oxaloacetate-decarboxylating)
MTDQFVIERGQDGHIISIHTEASGHHLLDNPKLNKGNAFSLEERDTFKLKGKLPEYIESLEDQSARTYAQYQEISSDLAKNIYLNSLHDSNETLFYHVVKKHLKEMLPIIYTPTVGKAVQRFSLEMRRTRGLYISYPDRHRIDDILSNRTNRIIDLIVVTDGEGVLGIGDQGIGGMNIAIAKLMVYVLCAGINPSCKLPIQLDVGTNNQQLLNDPMYLGWRHERINGEQYDEFIGLFVEAVRKQFPNIYLHWEDFGRDHARHNLERYQESMLTFNDDMQGTGAVALSAVLAGVKAAGRNLCQERIVFFGAGTAGCGMADQIRDAMVQDGLSKEEAQQRFWLIDRHGLLIDDMPDLMACQAPYARTRADIDNWPQHEGEQATGLLRVVQQAKATILIGCSTVSGAFNERVVKSMAANTKRPLIMPMSNPTACAEAHPANLLKWTDGLAMVATGSPFDAVEYEGKHIRISQANNAFVFPGLGLGLLACQAKRLSPTMLRAAADALSDASPALHDPQAPILPDLDQIDDISHAIALKVIAVARAEGLAQIDDKVDANQAIDAMIWHPRYYPYKVKNT